MSGQPLLLLDVDGVLNLQVPSSMRQHAKHDFDVVRTVPDTDLRVWVGRYGPYSIHWRENIADVFKPLTDVFRMVWCTTWQDAANPFWLPKLRLVDELPVIPLEWEPTTDGTCWKTSQVAAWLEEHGGTDPVGVWFDDDVSDLDRDELPEGILPVRVDPRPGLTDDLVHEAVDHVRACPGLVVGGARP